MVALPQTVYALDAATYSDTPDYADCFADVLRELKGEPNPSRSSDTEWRYGTNGSFSADLVKGCWHDHENDVGGGVLDLIARERKCGSAEAAVWFDENFRAAAATPRAALSAQRAGTGSSRAGGADGWAGGEPSWRRHVATHYDYHDTDGLLRLRVFRIERQGEPKTFRQATRRADGLWTPSAAGVEHVPYRLFELRKKVAHDQVFVVEGEKDVDRLASLGFLATCNAGGANKWPDELTQHFKGYEVYIIEDNDDAGRKHAQLVASKLHVVASSVRVVTLPDLPPKGDVSDWLDAGRAPEQLLDIAQAAPLWQPSAGDDWAAPLPLPTGLPAVPALDPGLLPDGIRPWIEDVADRMQCPLEYVAVAALVAASSVIGRQLTIRPKQHDDWTVVPNLWGCCVGRPGVLKTPALSEALKPVQAFEKDAAEAYEKEVKAHEKQKMVRDVERNVRTAEIKKKLKNNDRDGAFMIANDDEEPQQPQRRRYVVNDSTVEKLGEILKANPRGVLVFRDELPGFLRAMDKDGHEADRAFYLEAWQGDSRFTYDRIGRGTIDIEACCVSVLGGIQPGPLSAYLAAAARGGIGDDGLMQRFQLTVWPDIAKDWKNIDRLANSGARRHYQQAFQRLDAIDAEAVGANSEGGSLPFVRFDDLAQKMFDLWREGLEHRLRQDDLLPALEAHLAKYRSLVPSLALVFHLLSGHTGSVKHESLQLALRWAEFLEAHALRLYSTVVHADAHAAQMLAKHIRKRDLDSPYTPRQVVQKGWEGLGTTECVLAAIEVLAEHGWITRHEEKPKGNRGGRPSVRCEVNPKIFELGYAL